MRSDEPVVRAAIDVGSNTTHLVVAKSSHEQLEKLADEVKMIPTGMSVSETGELSTETQTMVLDTLRHYQNLAHQHGAEDVLVVATEALREARNSEAFLKTVEQETGLHVELISGRTEAALTFYGATIGIEAPEDAAVLDVGGGSSELVLSQQRHPTWLASLPIGSSKIHAQYKFANPPSCRDMARAGHDLAASLRDLAVPFLPPALVVTGSSALALLRIAQQVFQSGEQHDILTRDDLLRCEGMLCTLSARTVAQRYKQELKRAFILPGGALIIRSFMERLQRDTIYVSSYGVREGLLLAYARYGAGWLHHPDVSGETGWQNTQERVSQAAQQEGPPFIDAGRDVLSKRVRKMLDWRAKVLRHDDIEDVHKMRVASRRLRAAMDAYEVCCKSKLFKKIYREVKDLAGILGAVRDTDVMIMRLQQWAEDMPEAERGGVGWLMERLQAYRRERLRVMDEEVQSLDGGDLRRRIIESIRD